MNSTTPLSLADTLNTSESRLLIGVEKFALCNNDIVFRPTFNENITSEDTLYTVWQDYLELHQTFDNLQMYWVVPCQSTTAPAHLQTSLQSPSHQTLPSLLRLNCLLQGIVFWTVEVLTVHQYDPVNAPGGPRVDCENGFSFLLLLLLLLGDSVAVVIQIEPEQHNSTQHSVQSPSTCSPPRRISWGPC